MTDDDRFHSIATTKLTAVLGERAAIEHMNAILSAIGIERITSADELYRFASHLVTLGGFAGAVGGLLCVDAVMNGARS